ncbi:hypothetical protein I5Q96_11155 [Serratia marcescens]|nr:hypothetical protein [Serratia marcescens]MBH3041559.1 hypothetical protein [Serratia marcescens]
MAKLNKKERVWLDELQEVLNRCPSERLGFFTVGDPKIHIYDRSKERLIDDYMDSNGLDFCKCVRAINADFGDLDFPAAVHSTAG